MKKIISTSIFLGLSVAMCSPAISGVNMDGAVMRDLIPVQKPIAEIEPCKKSSLDVSAWVNKTTNAYRVGEKLGLFVKANRDAYITVIDIGTSGQTHVIYPNKFQPDNFVRGGEPVKIPAMGDKFDLEVYGRSGKEVIKVIATVTDEPIFQGHPLYPTQNNPYLNIRTRDIEVVAATINDNLNNASCDIDWAEYTKVVTVL